MNKDWFPNNRNPEGKPQPSSPSLHVSCIFGDFSYRLWPVLVTSCLSKGVPWLFPEWFMMINVMNPSLSFFFHILLTSKHEFLEAYFRLSYSLFNHIWVLGAGGRACYFHLHATQTAFAPSACSSAPEAPTGGFPPWLLWVPSQTWWLSTPRPTSPWQGLWSPGWTPLPAGSDASRRWHWLSLLPWHAFLRIIFCKPQVA